MPLFIIRNDIVQMKTDAIVNAANSTLLGGGGVDGAIHQAAGPELKEECRNLGGCKTGEAKITGGYRLCRYIIHTVGPIWHGGTHGEPELLASCYRNSLRLAAEAGCESVAFPLISSGAYEYPKTEAMKVAVETIRSFLAETDLTVYLVVYGPASVQAAFFYDDRLEEYIDDAYVEAHPRQRFPRISESGVYQASIESPLPKNSKKKQGKLNKKDLFRTEEGLRQETTKDNCAVDWDDCFPGSAAPEAIEADRVYPNRTASAPKSSLESFLFQLDESFSAAVLRLVDEKGMSDPDCYRAANITRQVFSKLRTDPDYKPKRPTALALAVALRLNYDETQELLKKAGMALSRSNLGDCIVEYYIRSGRWDIDEINLALFEHDQILLGASTK